MNLPHPIQLGACQLGQQGGIECPFSIKPIPQRRAFASNLTEDTRTGRVQAGASLAQLVEHFICNENVVGSIPTAGSNPNFPPPLNLLVFDSSTDNTHKAILRN
jgi:hypothetical protein